MFERINFGKELALGVTIGICGNMVAQKCDEAKSTPVETPKPQKNDNVQDALNDVRKQFELEHGDPSLNAPTQQFCEELEREGTVLPEKSGTKSTSTTIEVFRRAIVVNLNEGGSDVILECEWEQPKEDKNQKRERCTNGKCGKFTGMSAIQRSPHEDKYLDDNAFAPDHSFHGVDGTIDHASVESLPSTKHGFKQWDKFITEERNRYRGQFKGLVELGRRSLQEGTYRPISIADQNREYARRGGR